MRVLCRIAETIPTQRPDVAVIYPGLAAEGITFDLIALTEDDETQGQPGTGRALTAPRRRNRLVNYAQSYFLDLAIFPLLHSGIYDAVQVRDCMFGGGVAYIAARLKGKPVYYWASYPVWEGMIVRAEQCSVRHKPLRGLVMRLRGQLGAFLYRRFLLRRFDHVFVQSAAMREQFSEYGCDPCRMSVVPMGVDLGAVEHALATPVRGDATVDPQVPVIAYLGVIAREREMSFLIDVLARVRLDWPQARLLLVGDALESEERQAFEAYAISRRLGDAVTITGWLCRNDAWKALRSASLALSALPRSDLYDVSSPTKIVEYLALGIPVVVNDIPTQAEIVRQSSAGRCVPMDAEAFAAAVVELLGNPTLREYMGRAGREYVRGHLAYSQLIPPLADIYRSLLVKKAGAA